MLVASAAAIQVQLEAASPKLIPPLLSTVPKPQAGDAAQYHVDPMPTLGEHNLGPQTDYGGQSQRLITLGKLDVLSGQMKCQVSCSPDQVNSVNWMTIIAAWVVSVVSGDGLSTALEWRCCSDGKGQDKGKGLDLTEVSYINNGLEKMVGLGRSALQSFGFNALSICALISGLSVQRQYFLPGR